MLNISVIIPVYNAAAFLGKAVASALQFDEVKEILLIEDGSVDDSLTVCEKLVKENARIKLYRHSNGENHGAGASRNLGLEMASKDFIAFLDADDHYLPNRFEAEKELFKNEKTEGVFGALQAEFLSEKGAAAYSEKFKDTLLTTVAYPAEGKAVFEGLLGLSPKKFGTFFHLNTLTVRREALDKYNFKFNPELRVHQDSEFILRLAFHCHLKSGSIDRAVAVRGVHDDNRITQIKKFSPQYNKRQYLYWKSLRQWSLQTPVSSEAQRAIFLNYKSYDLSLKGGLRKVLIILLNALKHPVLLKSRYRYTFLKL